MEYIDIFTRDGQYIVQQRSLKAKYYAGKWDMIGGSVMAGETPEAAAIREVNDVKVMPFHEFIHHVSDHNDDDFCNELKETEKRL